MAKKNGAPQPYVPLKRTKVEQTAELTWHLSKAAELELDGRDEDAEDYFTRALLIEQSLAIYN